MEQPQNRRVNVRGIIYRNGELFCQQLKTNNSNVTEAFWCTPGGGIEFGESLHEGLHREMIEETGVAPEIGELLFVSQFHDGRKEQLEFFFHIKNASDYEIIDLVATSHGEIEVDVCKFIDPKTHNILPKFLRDIDLDAHTESSAPPLVLSELK